MITELRSRGLHLTILVALLLALAPSPSPGALVEHSWLAATAIQGGRSEQALTELQLLLQLAPEAGELSLAAARAALDVGDWSQAQRHAAQGRSVDVAAEGAACLELEIRLAAGRTQEALALLGEGPGGCRADAATLGRLAELSLARSDFTAAEGLLERLAQVDPGSAWAHSQLGVLISLRDPAAAVVFLRRAVELAPDREVLAGRLLRAIETGQALGGPARSLAQIGQELAAAGNWEQARQALERSIRMEPEAPGALALLGLALDQTGADGSDPLEAAAELAPDSAQVQQLLARHWRSRGDLGRAQTALETAARLDPGDPLIASDLGSLYVAMGDLGSAEAAYRYAVATAPQDPRFWTLLARFSLEQELELATLGLPAARTALRLAPGDAQALDLLAACHYLLGNLQVAERLLWQALTLDPRLAWAHYHRGLVDLAQGDLAGATRALQRAQALDPDGRVGELAARSLANLRQ